MDQIRHRCATDHVVRGEPYLGHGLRGRIKRPTGDVVGAGGAGGVDTPPTRRSIQRGGGGLVERFQEG